ncbi:hypothetical protein EPO05_06290 [Patescibacteria group bacterium]|nr:MAG: hypothetical protein EPO05_06290 [Patescibacteria group bacterium]
MTPSVANTLCKDSLRYAAQQTARDTKKRKLTKRGKEIHRILDQLMLDLDRAGVDVAYFPHDAEMLLIEYAAKLDKGIE